MGTDYFYKAVLLAGGLSMFLFFQSFQAEAQVVIEEKMEIEPQATKISGRDSIHTTATTGSDVFPFWLPVEQNRFMMLKSGALELHFEDAKLRQKMAQSDKVMLTVIRDGKEVRSKTITPLDHLPDPMNVNHARCYEDRFVYNTETMRVGIEADNDAYVAKGYVAKGIVADQPTVTNHNFGLGQLIVAAPGTGFVVDLDPDEEGPDDLAVAKAVSFLNFDLRNIKSEVDLQSAILSLHTLGPNSIPLGIAAANANWDEHTIIWDNQPSSGATKKVNGSLNLVSYHFNISDLIDLGQPQVGFKLEFPTDTTRYAFSSKEGLFGPGLLLDISNPAPPAADPTVKIDSLKAGDIVKWEFKDFDISDQYRNLVFGEDYYELEFQGPPSSSCTVERLNITAQIEDAYPGPPQIVMNLETSPDTVAPGDTAQITPHMHFVPDSVTAAFPAGQFFLAAIAEGPDFSTLWDGFGSTSDFYPRTRSPFYFIAADSIAADPSVAVVASSAKLRIDDDIVISAAPGQEAEKSKPSSVTGELPDPIEVRGTKQVVVRENAIDVNIEIPGTKELWPTIPVGGVQANFDRSQVGNTIEEVVVDVTNSGEPVENQPVTITANWVPGTGGHNHNGGDDLESPPLERMGWIVNIEEADSARGELATETNTDGLIRLRYRAPQFGGKVKLTAKTVNTAGDTLRAKDKLTVRVPGLVPLEEGGHYLKVGGTPSHHGPRVDGLFQSFRTPDQNHYGTQEFVDSLTAIADAWHEKVLADPAMDNRQTPLNINDMSLSNGGKFDIEGEFLERAAYHAYHRVGRDADIRTTRGFPITPSVRNGVLLRRRVIAGEEQYLNEVFENLWLSKGANPKPEVHGDHKEGTEHYHIYFYN